MRNSTETLIAAMRILSQDIQSNDGVVSAATAEAAQRLEEQQERIKRLEEMYEGEIGDNEQFLGSNLQGLLTRELNWSKERIKRLEDAFTELEQCNLTDENCANMDVATRRIRNFARRAKEAKP